ncbi:MAG: cobalt-precorrin-6A reductase [Rhodococcus sp.]|nr:cobalt-precorrin-6A reductase [Rhodococcus sp. (in: high G+C Gram-positive bacteria)]
MPRILILGGTGEARALAAALTDMPGIDLVSSLAGRVANPILPPGEVRSGGFGGADGLTRWIREQAIDAIVDATHPFAAQITTNAVLAADRCGTPLVVLRRPEWQAPVNAQWNLVSDTAAAAELLPSVGTRAFLTIGRQGVDAFAGMATMWFLVRAIDPPEGKMPPRAELTLARGPFTVAGETSLMRQRRIDVLVTKNSGGEQTAAKLEAAERLDIPVVVIERPPLPAGVSTVDDVSGAAAWVAAIT